MVPDSWSPRRCSSFLLAHYVCRNCNNSVRYSAQTSTYKIRDTLLAQKTSLPFPSANRSVLSTRWQAHKPRPLQEPKQLGHYSKKPPFLSSTDRSFVRDDRNGLLQEAWYLLLAIVPIHPAYYQRRSNYLLIGSFCPFDCPRVPRSSRNIIDTIGIYRFQ